MGMMDSLKSAIGMNTDPKQINADGKNYTFVPGQNGSLTAPLKQAPKPLVQPSNPVAKVIGPTKLAQVGSVRG